MSPARCSASRSISSNARPSTSKCRRRPSSCSKGEILADVHEDEGPYGEYTGYSTDRSTRNVFVVKAITSRHNPIFHDIIPGYSAEHLLLGPLGQGSACLHAPQGNGAEPQGAELPEIRHALPRLSVDEEDRRGPAASMP